jgi:3-deoxy-D-manno-octulosonic-acid transferase
LTEVQDVIRRGGGEARCWSNLRDPLEAGILQAFGAGEVVVVDRYGLLASLYGGGECAFVGGSLAPVGGHNLLEPLNWGVPVVFGPHTENTREIRDEVVNRSLGTEVMGAADLAEAIGRYLHEPSAAENIREGAKALFQANRGAVARALTALEALGALAGAG